MAISRCFLQFFIETCLSFFVLVFVNFDTGEQFCEFAALKNLQFPPWIVKNCECLDFLEVTCEMSAIFILSADLLSDILYSIGGKHVKQVDLPFFNMFRSFNNSLLSICKTSIKAFVSCTFILYDCNFWIKMFV